MAFAVGAAIAAVIAAAVSATAAISQAQTQAATAKYNKKVAENAALAQRQAAEIEAQNRREEGRRIMAAQRAAIGGSGVISTEGTPLVVQMETAEKVRLNEARALYAGEVGARQLESEAIIIGYQGRAAKRLGYMQAGASLLSGLSSAARIGAGAGGGGGGGGISAPGDYGTPGGRS